MENIIGTAAAAAETDLLSQNERLKEQLINASMLNELIKVLHSCTDLEGIVKTVLLSFQDLADFDRAILFSIDTDGFRVTPQSWVGIDGDALKNLSVTLGFDGGDITDAIFLNRHIFVEEPDPSYDVFAERLQSSSYIVVPLLKKPTRRCWEIKGCNNTGCPSYGGVNPYCWSNMNSCVGKDCDEDTRRKSCLACPAFMTEGVFWFDRQRSGKPITSDDITVLTNIITLAGLIFENFRMMNALDAANHELTNANDMLRSANYELEVAQTKIRLDLEQARTIQQRLLPQDLESSQVYSVSSRYQAANTVGGDYYDLFKLADHVYGIVVADVSGHGIASALIMAMAKVLLKTYSKNELSPKKTLELINEAFLNEVATEHFVTIFYAVFDTEKKKITYSSAGHCPILYIDKSDGSCELLKADGLFMGVFPDMLITEKELDYTLGVHRLVLYTDGLTEAVNPECEMYGAERLITAAKDTRAMDHNEALEAILKDQKKFCGNMEQEDDVTLLVVDF